MSLLSHASFLLSLTFYIRVAYALFVGIKKTTFLAPTTLPETAYELIPTINIGDMLAAAILGLVSGVLGLIGFLFQALGKMLGKKCEAFLNSLGTKVSLPDRLMGTLFTPVVGGALLGLLAKACPLILGDGSQQMAFIFINAHAIGAGGLVATMFAKIVSLSIALGFGFIGGQIFPLLFSGTCLGAIAWLWVPQVNVVVAVTSCVVGVPCAILPAMLTFTTLVSLWIALGGSGTSPIFVSGIISYTTLCGFGIVQDLIVKASSGGAPSSGKLPVQQATEKQDTDV